MISNSYVLGLFGGSSAGSLSTTTATALAMASRKQPTPPWSTNVDPPKPSDLLRAAMGGRRLINEDAAKLDLTSASTDYRKLFALYQGLDTLNVLVNRAATKGVGALELTQLNKRFASGLGEVASWLGQAGLDDLRLVQGTASAMSKSSAGVQRDSAISITAPIHEGSPDQVSPAFSGDVRFDVTARTSVETKRVSIDLDEMGSTPRTLTNVLDHINAKLKDGGVEARIGRELVKTEPKTMTVNGKPVTLPAGPDRYALAVRGNSTETIGFQAAATSDAVYVVQAGAGEARQLLKFQSDGGGAPTAAPRAGETQWVEGRTLQSTLPPGVETVRASATAPDGSLWLVADLDAGPANQPIKGQRDVALMKLDSSGRVISTQALGAASTASGYAISVDADGKVAVAGSVTGALESGQSGDVAAVADSFVTVFDASGKEIWTQRRGSRAADQATSVSFGADGMVYVGGRAQGAVTGGVAQGGWDGYVQAFSQTQAHQFAPVVATSARVVQFGGVGEDGVSAVAVSGSTLYSAGVEGGRLMVRSFSLDASGRPSPLSTRDLGEASGSVSGLSVVDGKVVVTGTTRNAGLDVDAVNTAHHGGTDAFVAVLQGDLAASGADRLTYVGAAGDDTAADMKIMDGKVWITGVADRPEGAKPTDTTGAYLARLDPLSGAVEWRRDWQGDGAQAAPLTLATAKNGASVLDRLGLPQGEIAQASSKVLTEATALRVGDRFYVSPANGGRPVAVTIDARDTLQTLARKIEQASNRKLKVTVTSAAAEAKAGDPAASVFAGVQRLSITARDGATGATLTSGETGRDALTALGVSPGYVGPTSGDDQLRTFGLDLPRGLNLSDAAAIKQAGERLQASMKVIRDAYRALAPTPVKSPSGGGSTAYYSSQLANYQAALSRLGG